MNIDIDWSIAPDWAIGHALHVSGCGAIKEVWVGEDKYQRLDQSKSFCYGGGIGEARHNPCRYQFKYETPRPAPWTGEGLPPVGVVCEYGKQGQVRIITHFDQTSGATLAVGQVGERGMLVLATAESGSFRPIRTPEQIAAEERERDVIAALEVMKFAHWNIKNTEISPLEKCRVYAEAMVDAGYSKQVAP